MYRLSRVIAYLKDILNRIIEPALTQELRLCLSSTIICLSLIIVGSAVRALRSARNDRRKDRGRIPGNLPYSL